MVKYKSENVHVNDRRAALERSRVCRMLSKTGEKKNMEKTKRMISALLSVFMAVTVVLFSPLGPVRASAANDKRIVVSLGDSYSSGEGIEPFYGQEKSVGNKVSDADWLAHRSTLAWPGQLTLSGVSGTLAENRGDNWYFAAASGAKAENLKEPQQKNYNITDSKGKNYKGSAQLEPQLDVFDDIKAGSVDYVTLTLGGNDADFAGVITTLFVGEVFPAFAGNIDSKLDVDAIFKGGLKDTIKQAYKDIAEKAGSEAAIIVAGYPTLLRSDGFSFEYNKNTYTVSAEKTRKINDAVEKFNGRLKAIVDECRKEGINILFVSVAEEFAGHEAYTDDPYINPVFFGSKDEDLLNGLTGSSYSMHPNAKGAAAYARAVGKVIEAYEKGEYPKTATSASEAGSSVDVSVNGSSVMLSWNKTDGAESYTVYMRKNGTYKAFKTTKKTSLTITGLKNNTTYSFLIRSRVNGKLSAAADSLKTSVRVYFKPAPKAVAGSGGITLKWEAVPGASKYKVYSVADGKLKAVGATGKTSIRIGEAISGKEYTYAVRALVNGKWTTVNKSDFVSITAK